MARDYNDGWGLAVGRIDWGESEFGEFNVERDLFGVGLESDGGGGDEDIYECDWGDERGGDECDEDGVGDAGVEWVEYV